jgi:hypothetical protein
METVTYLREKAEQCRRLADYIVGDNDPAKAALLALADELDVKAEAQESRAVVGGAPSSL